MITWLAARVIGSGGGGGNGTVGAARSGSGVDASAAPVVSSVRTRGSSVTAPRVAGSTVPTAGAGWVSPSGRVSPGSGCSERAVSGSSEPAVSGRSGRSAPLEGARLTAGLAVPGEPSLATDAIARERRPTADAVRIPTRLRRPPRRRRAGAAEAAVAEPASDAAGADAADEEATSASTKRTSPARTAASGMLRANRVVLPAAGRATVANQPWLRSLVIWRCTWVRL